MILKTPLNVARHIQLNYPDLNLLAGHGIDIMCICLRDLGVEHIWRETYLSSLGMAYFALRNLGIAEQDAYKSIELFRDYDENCSHSSKVFITMNRRSYETHRKCSGRD